MSAEIYPEWTRRSDEAQGLIFDYITGAITKQEFHALLPDIYFRTPEAIHRLDQAVARYMEDHQT